MGQLFFCSYLSCFSFVYRHPAPPLCRGSGQALQPCGFSGRFLSDIRADRSTLRRASSSEDDHRHFIVIASGGSALSIVKPMRGGDLSANATLSPPSHQHKARSHSSRCRESPLPFCVGSGFPCRLSGLTFGTQRHRRCCIGSRRSPCFGVVP